MISTSAGPAEAQVKQMRQWSLIRMLCWPWRLPWMFSVASKWAQPTRVSAVNDSVCALSLTQVWNSSA